MATVSAVKQVTDTFSESSSYYKSPLVVGITYYNRLPGNLWIGE